MNFSDIRTSKPSVPPQEINQRKGPIRASNSIKLGKNKDFSHPPEPSNKLGSFKLKNSKDEPQDFPEKNEDPVYSYLNKDQSHTPIYSRNNRPPAYMASSGLSEDTEGFQIGQSQTQKPARIKLNIKTGNARPQNIFSKEIKSQIFRDMDKKKSEIENLIKEENGNVPQKKFDSKMRIRVMKQRNQETRNSNFEEIQPDRQRPTNKFREDQEVSNHFHDYLVQNEEFNGDQTYISEEIPSPEANYKRFDKKSSWNSKGEEDDEEEKGLNDSNIRKQQYNSRVNISEKQQMNSTIKKGQFIIHTRSSVAEENPPNDNDKGKANVTPRIKRMNSGIKKQTGFEKRGSFTSKINNKGLDSNQNIINNPSLKQEKSNVYADPGNNPKNMVESLYSGEDLKRLSLSHKMKGNEYFKLKDWNRAIDEYSKAIKLYAKDSTYFSNRAVCYKMLIQWEKVIIDCEVSISLSASNFKAFNLKGHALVELGKKESENNKVEQGIIDLERAIQVYCDNGEVGDVNIKNELEVKINKAKKILWLKDYKEKQKKKQELTDYVNGLISKDATKNKNLKFDPNEIFKKLVQEKQEKEVKEIPEYLCCKITFDLMKDPIMTPYGIGYEKTVLSEHIKKNGNFDPVTRRPLPSQLLIPNKSLGNAIKEFVKKNPWSYEFISLDEDYEQISL